MSEVSSEFPTWTPPSVCLTTFLKRNPGEALGGIPEGNPGELLGLIFGINFRGTSEGFFEEIFNRSS